MKIYVLTGGTSRFDGHSTWMVRAFTDKDEAYTFRANCERRAAEIFAMPCWEAGKPIFRVTAGPPTMIKRPENEYDSGMDELDPSYYYVEEVDLKEAEPVPTTRRPYVKDGQWIAEVGDKFRSLMEFVAAVDVVLGTVCVVKSVGEGISGSRVYELSPGGALRWSLSVECWEQLLTAVED